MAVYKNASRIIYLWKTVWIVVYYVNYISHIVNRAQVAFNVLYAKIILFYMKENVFNNVH